MLQIPIGRLELYARDNSGRDDILKTVEVRIQPVEGGYASAGILRITLVTQFQDGQVQETTFVQKYTSSVELRILQELHRTITSPALLPLIDYQDAEGDTRPAWYIMPFYPDGILTWEDEIPEMVIRMLAQIHVRFEERAGKLKTWTGLRVVDPVCFNQTVERAIQSVETAMKTRPGHPFDQLYQQMQVLHGNQDLESVLRMLPPTLTHGDIHPYNIARAENGAWVLLDWGLASIAPGMLDIANMITKGSREWEIYLAALAKERGQPVDLRLAELGYLWATIQINMVYLPFVIETARNEEHAVEMIQKALDAHAQISRFLDIRDKIFPI